MLRLNAVVMKDEWGDTGLRSRQKANQWQLLACLGFNGCTGLEGYTMMMEGAR